MATADIAGASTPASRVPRICFSCERTFHRRSSGESDALKCCSRTCGWAWQVTKKAALAPIRFVVAKAKCLHCMAWFEQKNTGNVYCSTECREKVPRYTAVAKVHRCCRDCEAPIVGTAAKVVCSPCLKKRGRASARLSGAKSAHRRARKLKQRGVTVEVVNPVAVLNRDGWTCKLCGVKTPKRLRGSYDARAPEVDHIVSIAEGGEHSYANVQCACRRCNLAKSSHSKGQMRLFG